MDHLIESNRSALRSRLQELQRLRQMIQSEQNVINELIRYIHEHERELHNPAYLEELLLVINGPDSVETGEEYCRLLYRIASRMNTELESALSFRASVNLQMLRYWAQQRGWSERVNFT